MKRLSAFPIACTVIATAFAGHPVGAQTTARSVATPEHIRFLLSALAHDSMEGRGTGTPGSMRAAKFIASQFQAAGLTPAGDSGFFQHVPMATRMTDPSSTITADGTTLHAGVDFAVAAGRANPRSLDGVAVIYGGTRGDPDPLTADQVRGKLVVFSAGASPGGARGGAGGAGGRGRPPAPASCRDTPADGASPAATRGGGGRGGRGGSQANTALSEAAGVATIEGDQLSARSIWSAKHTGTAFVKDPAATAPTAPPGAAMVSITTHAAEALLGAPAATVAKGAAGKTIHSSVKFMERRANGGNVVGVIEGSDPAMKNQVILVDAHYDHLGIGLPPAGSTDSIYNGADDDASGTTAVIEIARALEAGPPPKRTVVLIATTGEEVGLLGTNWYIAHPVRPLSQMAANLEIEMIDRPDALAGGPGKGWLTGFERSTLGDTLAARGLPIVKDPRPDQGFFSRSDNIAFARMGIPAHTLSSFDLHADYHQSNDDVNLADFNHMASVIGAGISVVRLLADGFTPVWYPNCKP
jgi:hypothetical protein